MVRRAQSPEHLLTLANGQFCNIFKILNTKERSHNIKCPRKNIDPAKSPCNPKSVITWHMLNKPFPFLLLIDLNWNLADMNSKNCLTIIASLPPFFFIPNIYELNSIYDPETYMTLYKLKSLICFTGSHYFTFMRVQSQLSPTNNAWHLFNDTEIKLFGEWFSVVQYIVQANCCPTLVIYERHQTSQPMSA